MKTSLLDSATDKELRFALKISQSDVEHLKASLKHRDKRIKALEKKLEAYRKKRRPWWLKLFSQ